MDWENLIPYIHPEDSRIAANAFLAKYNREGVLPLPIEKIVEFNLGINIVPIPGLERRLETVGFITSDLTEIDIDLDVAERFPSRFRWTIAHEVGHVLLHRPLYQAQTFAARMNGSNGSGRYRPVSIEISRSRQIRLRRRS